MRKYHYTYTDNAKIESKGKTRKQEFYYGSSYYSQSSRILKVYDYMRKVNIVKYNGEQRNLDVSILGRQALTSDKWPDD